MDIITSVGNPEKVRKVLGWGAKTNFSTLVQKLIACEIKRRHKENAEYLTSFRDPAGEVSDDCA
jgi:hypothetical protein